MTKEKEDHIRKNAVVKRYKEIYSIKCSGVVGEMQGFHKDRSDSELIEIYISATKKLNQ